MIDSLVITAKFNKNSWPVRVSKIRDGEYEISGRGTSYQIVLIPRVNGVLVAITNWNRCGYVNYYGTIDAEDVMNYLDMGNQVDACTVAAGLNEIFRRDIFKTPEVINFLEQRRALIEKLRQAKV